MNRRTFINTWIRTGILGAFALMIGIFAAGGKITGNGECSAEFQCRGCKKLSKCSLPESDKYRNNGKG
ncbi:MAG: hypothetical protein IH594_17200 [Bacteroidales bacterium]|nr:hypothetical protein [Bacteroidales bacterium]